MMLFYSLDITPPPHPPPAAFPMAIFVDSKFIPILRIHIRIHICI
jgi:hypothetical protein